MPSFLQVKLSESEDQTLEQLSLANTVPKRTKQRAITKWQASPDRSKVKQ